MAEDTVIDLVNAAERLDEAVGWVTAAFARRLTSEHLLRQALAARPRVRWRREIDEVITLAAGGTHSVLEFRYDRDVERAHGLPPSQRQAPFTKRDGRRGFRDRYYGQYGRLVVELDGRQYHADEGRDRVRDNQAAATGGATLRYDWTAVTRRPCETAAEVFHALRRRGYEGAVKPCGPACRVPREVAVSSIRA
jgi:very-short-patch-repair endonuclease